MLELDSTEALELGLVAISNKAKRIPETKRLLNTNFSLERLDGGRRSLLAGRGKGSGRSNEGGSNDGLHVGRGDQ